MNDPSADMDREVRELLNDAGVTVALFNYSPDYNPIELVWSKVRVLLRKAEARTNEALLLAIGAPVSRATRNDTTHWSAHCGS